MEYQEVRELMCDIGRRMYEKSWGAANDGNLSVKLADGLYMTTPTHVSKGFMKPDMMIILDGDAKVVESNGVNRPTSEATVHIACYKLRPDVGGIVHAHPPVSTAFACAGLSMNGHYHLGTSFLLGSVPCVPFGFPGGEKLINVIKPYLEQCDVMLLANHGMLALGDDLEKAFAQSETCEYLANLLMNIKALGGAKELPEEIIQEAFDKWNRAGTPGKHPGFKQF